MPSYLGRILSWVIHHASRIKSDYIDRNELMESEEFDDLTPHKNFHDGKYYKALDWALSNKSVKNIAITGIYGSGKSSFLRSYQERHPEHQYLNISLASFSPNTEKNQKENISNNENDLHRLIERSILQQIFYTVNPKDIPDSRFKKIYSVNNIKLFIHCILLTIWLASIAILFDFNTANALSIWNEWEITESIYINYIATATFIAGVIWIMFKLLRGLSSLSFSKLNIAKGEIELSKDIDSSILNDNLDEILYFFEVNKYNIVILEDIDRYDEIDVFTKLRELNILINRSKQVNRDIKFIYAIRDELFASKEERTKFFDFIIPIIPIINSTNSGDKLIEILNRRNMNKEISNDLIYDISIYVSDMRILKNIVNEYTIYKYELEKVSLNKDKLFSMILYKNLNPEDFSKLQQGEGLIYEVFENKERVIKKKQAEIKKEVSKMEESLDYLRDEHLESLQELRRLYIAEFLLSKSNEGVSQISLDNQLRPVNQLVKEKYFNEWRTSSKVHYRNSKNQNRQYNFDFQQLENKLNSSLSYEERQKRLQSRLSNIENETKEQIENLKNQLNELEYKQLYELFNLTSAEQLLGEKISKNELLVFLFRNGFIDENFESYVSFFYEGSLTINDKNYILAIKNHSSRSYNFELSHIKEIIDRLRHNDFQRPEIFNFDMLKFILENTSSYKNQKTYLFDQLANESDSSLDFIDNCLDNKKVDQAKFIKLLCSHWHGIWFYIQNKSDYSTQKVEQYFDLIINYATQNDIDKINSYSDNSFVQYISDMQNFPAKYQQFDRRENVEHSIRHINVKFRKLNVGENDDKMLDFIYQNNLYEINYEMLSCIITNKSNVDATVPEKLLTYSAISSSGLDELKSYINSNIDIYVEKVLLDERVLVDESQEHFISLLSNNEINIDNKVRLIELQQSQIDDLSLVPTNLWDVVLRENKTKASWENVIKYYVQNESLNDTLIDFFNRVENSKALSTQEINANGISNNIVNNLEEEIILSEEIKFENYQQIIRGVRSKFDQLDISGVNPNKIKCLLNNDVLTLTPRNYESLKKVTPPAHIKLVEKNTHSFINNFASYKIEDDDLNALLRSTKLTDSNKIKILELLNVSQFDISKETSNQIVKTYLAVQPYTVTPEEMRHLFNIGNSKEGQIKLLLSQIDKLGRENVRQIILSLGYPHYKMGMSQHRPKIKKTEYNIELVEKLKNIRVISSYKMLDAKIRVNARVWS